MCSKLFGIALIFAAIGASQSVCPQADYKERKWNNRIGHSSWDVGLDTADRKEMLALWETIGEDLKSEENVLAGTYVKGGYDAGYFLRWSIKKGFVLIPYFDQNLITDFSYGKVTFVDPSEIIFTPERELNGYRTFARMPRKWTAIWHYLVPVEMLKQFGEFHAGLKEYNEFNGQCCEFWPEFLSARIDSKEKWSSYPVPAKYAHFIKSSINGQITFVGRKRKVRNWSYDGKLYHQWMDNVILVSVRINVGRDRGVKKNMLFRIVGEPETVQYVQIMRVSRHSSTAYVVRDLSDDGKETYHDFANDQVRPLAPIRLGMKITTRPVAYLDPR